MPPPPSFFFFLCAAAAASFFFALLTLLLSSSFRFPDDVEHAATPRVKKQVRLPAAAAKNIDS